MSITMKASSFYSSSLSPCPCTTQLTRRQRRSPAKVFASHRGEYGHSNNNDNDNGHDYNGKLVDESMIILRMRIREIKMEEENNHGYNDQEVSSDWMEWEKNYYRASYDKDVCEAMGILQVQLMKTRPSLALAMLALFSMSVPMSMGVVLMHLIEMAKGGLLGIHF